MLAETNLPKSFWTYALSTYRHVHNQCQHLPSHKMSPLLRPTKAKDPKLVTFRFLDVWLMYFSVETSEKAYRGILCQVFSLVTQINMLGKKCLF
ncbi:hypothetical protein J132_01474 [Termitomyces sp. J132]|nr:hypothetical protein J132_01474 [Termitomyces sp. J132]